VGKGEVDTASASRCEGVKVALKQNSTHSKHRQ